MEPSDGTEKVSGMGFMTNVGRFHILNMNITDVKKGQKVGIFCAPIGNTGDQPFTGEVDVALMNAKGEMRKIVTSSPLTVDNLAAGRYYPYPSFNFVSTVDAEPGDYLAIVAKENGSSEYIELYDSNFERLRLPATGYKPLTFEVSTKMGDGATFQLAGTGYNSSYNFYNGKPVIGAWYYYYLTVDEGISQYFVELNGKLMDDVKLGTTVYPNSFRGIEPVYDLVVTTYRNYQEKELVINLEKAGQLKQTLAKENPDYLVYRNIKVNGEIDKRDFDELASHYFKSIDLSGAKVLLDADASSDSGSGRKSRRQKKPNEPKMPKVASKEVSYDFYMQGMTVDQIAAKRGYTKGTIIGHLTPYVKEGKIGQIGRASCRERV